jgi:hypothetical protein
MELCPAEAVDETEGAISGRGVPGCDSRPRSPLLWSSPHQPRGGRSATSRVSGLVRRYCLLRQQRLREVQRCRIRLHRRTNAADAVQYPAHLLTRILIRQHGSKTLGRLSTVMRSAPPINTTAFRFTFTGALPATLANGRPGSRSYLRLSPASPCGFHLGRAVAKSQKARRPRSERRVAGSAR